ncbi:MAG: DUF551 domain-containing protein [Pseudomonadota bacterium]
MSNPVEHEPASLKPVEIAHTRLDVMSLIRSQMHRVYASAIDREEVDTKYMTEIESAIMSIYHGRYVAGYDLRKSEDAFCPVKPVEVEPEQPIGFASQKHHAFWGVAEYAATPLNQALLESGEVVRVYSRPSPAPVVQSQWIGVDEQLPELHCAVALLNDDKWMNTGGDFEINWQAVGWLCEFGSKFWHVIGAGRGMTLDSVTHWMPLPPAPGEVSVPVVQSLTDEQIDAIAKQFSTTLRGWEWSGEIIEVNGWREYEFARAIEAARMGSTGRGC